MTNRCYYYSQQNTIVMTRKKSAKLLLPRRAWDRHKFSVPTRCDLLHAKPSRAISVLLVEERTIRADIPPNFELHLEAVCNQMADMSCAV